jgi:hypothetical protein
MSEPKPFASLSSGLLARKGSAKPAMRPQGFTQLNGNLEDLGWNDMGHPPSAPAQDHEAEPQEHVPSSIAALTPAPKPHETGHVSGAPVPVEQQRAIAESFGTREPEEVHHENHEPAVAAPVVPITSSRPRRAPGQKEKAAFTLRLDPERHLKLRLACAVNHRSAQQIVSQALDEFLQSLPELDALAQQVPARAAAQD